MKRLLSILGLLYLPTAAFAQSSPNLSYGQVPTAGQWNSYFASKQDALGFRPINRAGDTMTGRLTIAPSQTSSGAGFNVSPGFDPLSPNNGDIWYSANGFFVRWNGTTFSLSGGPVSCLQMPALTGDVTLSPGSCATTLQTVNGAPGTYGSATTVPAFTVDGKGRVSSIRGIAIQIPSAQVMGLGTAATANTSTSGGTLGLLNASKTDSGNNTYTGTNGHSGTEVFTGPIAAQNSPSGVPGYFQFNTPDGIRQGFIGAWDGGTNLVWQGENGWGIKIISPTIANGVVSVTPVTNDNSTKIASTGFVQNQISASISSSSVLGFRNRLINGDDRIDQRNGGAAQTITGAPYTDDRFLVAVGGGTVTGQQIAGGTNATPVQNRYQITGGAGVTAISRCQRIEAANSFDLAGQSAVLSVDLANSTMTSVVWTVGYASAINNFTSITAVASGSFPVTASLARYSTPPVSIPTAATTGLQVCVNVGAQTSGTWTIGAEQFEAGNVATAFERRPLSFELAASQRYYEMSSAYTHYNYGTGLWGGDPIKFAVTKRAAPTLTSNVTTYANSSALTLTSPGVEGFNWSATVNASGGFYVVFSWTASAEM